MDSDWRKRIQITLIVVFVIALVRIAVIFYERTHWTEVPKPEQTRPSSYKITDDDFVTPHKLFPYDLVSARELVGKTVWIRTGNQLAYYHYAARRVDLSRSAGFLEPLEKLEVKDVISQDLRGKKQIMAVFTRTGLPGEYAISVGTVVGGTYAFTINDILFLDDPHQLYSHWPADVWNAIDQHQAKLGMNELQASFALGTNIRVGRGDYGNRTVEYLNSGKLVSITFSDNRAVTVEPETHP